MRHVPLAIAVSVLAGCAAPSAAPPVAVDPPPFGPPREAPDCSGDPDFALEVAEGTLFRPDLTGRVVLRVVASNPGDRDAVVVLPPAGSPPVVLEPQSGFEASPKAAELPPPDAEARVLRIAAGATAEVYANATAAYALDASREWEVRLPVCGEPLRAWVRVAADGSPDAIPAPTGPCCPDLVLTATVDEGNTSLPERLVAEVEARNVGAAPARFAPLEAGSTVRAVAHGPAGPVVLHDPSAARRAWTEADLRDIPAGGSVSARVVLHGGEGAAEGPWRVLIVATPGAGTRGVASPHWTLALVAAEAQVP